MYQLTFFFVSLKLLRPVNESHSISSVECSLQYGDTRPGSVPRERDGRFIILQHGAVQQQQQQLSANVMSVHPRICSTMHQTALCEHAPLWGKKIRYRQLIGLTWQTCSGTALAPGHFLGLSAT